jgi:hypothetical protein
MKNSLKIIAVIFLLTFLGCKKEGKNNFSNSNSIGSNNFTIRNVSGNYKVVHSAWTRSWVKWNGGWRKKRLSKTVQLNGNVSLILYPATISVII